MTSLPAASRDDDRDRPCRCASQYEVWPLAVMIVGPLHRIDPRCRRSNVTGVCVAGSSCSRDSLASMAERIDSDTMPIPGHRKSSRGSARRQLFGRPSCSRGKAALSLRARSIAWSASQAGTTSIGAKSSSAVKTANSSVVLSFILFMSCNASESLTLRVATGMWESRAWRSSSFRCWTGGAAKMLRSGMRQRRRPERSLGRGTPSPDPTPRPQPEMTTTGLTGGNGASAGTSTCAKTTRANELRSSVVVR